ncbi:hypothetical protein B0H63DRAFT_508576 [Podospora didyma]|uniref:Uncharacterized protein n=1 Tax=Podospora didyma TaxID=330526 RepID=A0AAE0U0M0_9PEZI|nr:hypothetical protein B0H63DRAFT_508576 [Podospora didyma]
MVSATTSTTTGACPLPTQDDSADDDFAGCSDGGESFACDDLDCDGLVIPSPLPNAGAMCLGVLSGCACTGATANTPIFCPSNLLPATCEDNGCNGTAVSGSPICQDAFKGCACRATPRTPGNCPNLGRCSFCGGTAPPGETFGHCPVTGCLCIVDPVQSTTITTTPQQPSSTPPPAPPTPTGGFWLGHFTTNFGNNIQGLTFIGDKDNSCARFAQFSVSNIAAFQAFANDASGNPIINAVSTLSSPNTFSVSTELLGNESDLCGIRGLHISFTPDGDLLAFDDHQPGQSDTQGFCVRVQDSGTTCTPNVPDLPFDITFTLQQFWHCAALNNPDYCNV